MGHPARFELFANLPAPGVRRLWSGVCNHLQLQRVEPSGLSTYHVSIVPALWLATQRRNHRIFQQLSEPEIVQKLLAEWEIKPVVRLSGQYKPRKYRVQYGESDHAFMSRLMEDVGISYYFEQSDDSTVLVMSDTPQANEPRKVKIPFQDQPSVAVTEHVTAVQIGRRVRPGRYTMQDHDYRRAANNQPRASATAKNAGVEHKLERFHYTPGAFLFRAEKGDPTPAADDRGMARTDDAEAARMAQNRLDAKRGRAKICTFETNAHDLAPGVVMGMLDHPRTDLMPDKPWLVAATTFSGKRDEKWSHRCEARSAEIPFRPALTTDKPATPGVESATVVGPAADEIHTDEFGRVRVHFHWDRESKMNELSSCWLHVNQPWGGTGYGGTNLPRVGQEVLVDFLNGDPDRPVIIGRVYTNLQKTPYSLPGNKTQSGWKSNSSPTTGGYNELMFEDKAGEELVRMQAEKDLHKLVKNDEQVKIGNDRSKEVGHDDFHKVGNDRNHEIGNDENIKIGNDRNKQVGGNHSSSIGKSAMEQIGESLRQMVGENKSEVVGNNRSAMIGNHDLIQAEEKITLQCGESSITLEADGTITIMGKDLVLGSGGPIRISAKENCDIEGDEINLN